MKINTVKWNKSIKAIKGTLSKSDLSGNTSLTIRSKKTGTVLEVKTKKFIIGATFSEQLGLESPVLMDFNELDALLTKNKKEEQTDISLLPKDTNNENRPVFQGRKVFEMSVEHLKEILKLRGFAITTFHESSKQIAICIMKSLAIATCTNFNSFAGVLIKSEKPQEEESIAFSFPADVSTKLEKIINKSSGQVHIYISNESVYFLMDSFYFETALGNSEGLNSLSFVKGFTRQTSSLEPGPLTDGQMTSDDELEEISGIKVHKKEVEKWRKFSPNSTRWTDNDGVYLQQVASSIEGEDRLTKIGFIAKTGENIEE